MYPFRRHLPPPRTNFEKLQDILLKRKGMTLDVSSSGALAASLDKCVVRPLISTRLLLPKILPFRMPTNRPSIPSSESWLHGVCSQQNISAQAASEGTHLGIMDSPVPYTPISPVRFDGMPVSFFFSCNAFSILSMWMQMSSLIVSFRLPSAIRLCTAVYIQRHTWNV